MTFMNSFLSAVRRKLFHPMRLAIVIAVLAMTIVSAPFQSGIAFDLPGLIGFWALCLSAGITLAVLVETGAEYGLKRLDLIPRRVIETLVFGVVIGGFVHWVVLLTYPVDRTDPVSFWMLFMVLGGIYGFVSLAKMLVPASAVVDEEPAFLKRLSSSLGKSVNWVSSNDHYVEVCTDKGREMILMRFSDAVTELDSLHGVRVHRSYWVRVGAVRGSETSNGKTILLLKDGTRIPVSRSYREAAENAGVL